MSYVLKLLLVCAMSLFALGNVSFAYQDPANPTNEIGVTTYKYFGLSMVEYADNNGNVTKVSGGMQESGYYGTDGSWIVQSRSMTRLDSSGNVTGRITYDPINRTFREYDSTGQLDKAYTFENGVDLNGDGDTNDRLDAEITRDAQGRLESIGWKSWVEQSKDVYVEKVTQMQYFYADGRQSKSETIEYSVDQNGDGTKEWVDGGVVTKSTVYEYDAAKQLTKTTTYEGQISGVDPGSAKKLAESIYAAGRVYAEYKFTYTESGQVTRTQTAQYFYEGGRLVKSETYAPADEQNPQTAGAPEGTYLVSKTIYDAHERPVQEYDSRGYLISEWKYNDTGTRAEAWTPNFDEYGNYTGDSASGNMVEAGGLLFSVSYLRDDAGKMLKHTTTLYYNGSERYRKSDTTVYHTGNINDYLRSLGATITAGVDPTINGTISVDSTGKIILTVTNQEQFNAMIAALDTAIASAEAANAAHGQTTSSVLESFKRIKEKLVAQWAAEGKVSVLVGAIDESKLPSGVWDGGAASINLNSADYWSDAIINQILGGLNNGDNNQTLTWNFWGEDAQGNIWIFANAAQV